MSEQNLPLGLYWKDKRTTVERIVLPFQSLEVIETINESRATREKEKGTMFKTTLALGEGDWRNKLIWGDNKYVMSALVEQFAGKIDLIYIDPPFATGANFSTTVEIGENEIKHTKEASAMEELAYRDTWGKGLDSFLQMLYDRLVLMRELLSDKGQIFVHLDWHVGHYSKLVLDEIFGYERFLNEIIWRRMTPSGFKGKTSLGKSHDVILNYSKSDYYVYNPIKVPYTDEYIKERFSKVDENGKRFKDEKIGTATTKQTIEKLKKEGRIYYTATGGMRIKHYLEDAEGFALDDVWADIPAVNSQAIERVDYPTQKPEALLERIIKASSNVDDLVADFFCGSGTTAVVAERLNRKWIAADLGRFAMHTTRKRMLEINACKPFEILNIGRYERQFWQTLHFGNKKLEQTLAEYIAFILQLYKAESLPGSSYIHGKKGNKLVHIGSVEAHVTLEDIQMAIGETRRMKQKELVILGWEWEMGLHDVIEQEASKAGVKLTLLNIPREVMDKRAVDAGDVQFFELAYLETENKQNKAGQYMIQLKDFIIPNLDLIPAEIKKMIKKWSDYIDYWSVDWNYKNDTFHNMWQSYRTKKDRTLELKTDPYEYSRKGDYKAMIKVIDIFGNDTTQIVEIKHR
jgi:adenine specific DNA methylase Mod